MGQRQLFNAECRMDCPISIPCGCAAAKTATTPVKLEGGILVTRDAPNATGLATLEEAGGAAASSTPHVDAVKAEPAPGPRSAPAFVSADVKEEREAALESPLPEALSQGLLFLLNPPPPPPSPPPPCSHPVYIQVQLNAVGYVLM